MTKFISKTYRYTIDNNSSAKVGGKTATYKANKQKRMVPRQAEVEDNFTGRVPGSDWLKMLYRSYFPLEHAYHCLNKSLAINTHYNNFIMYQSIPKPPIAPGNPRAFDSR